MSEELSKTAMQEWVQRRVAAVHENYTAFTALMEAGVDSVPDDSTPTQISCPFHGEDRRPSARYYPRHGGAYDYVYCFKCKERWDCINLVAKFGGVRFMEALSRLERRFNIKTPQRPEAAGPVDPVERGSNYESDKWKDVPTMLSVLERKLRRARDKCAMLSFIKFCRVMDAVQYDFEKDGKATPEMSSALRKLADRIDAAVAQAEAAGSL